MHAPASLTEEQSMLRDSVRRWAQEIDPRGSQNFASAWSQFRELGWLMAGLAESAGGLGGDAHDRAIIAEELGRRLVRAPYIEFAAVAPELLLALGEDVTDLAAGETKSLFAHEEPQSFGDPDWVQTRARRRDDRWLLSGSKSAILGAPHADRFLISAIVDGKGPTIFSVPAALAPLRTFVTIDDRPCGELVLNDTPGEPVGALGEAANAIALAVDHALVLESAESLGAMQSAFDITRDYLRTRRQFGQALSEFQALRHRLADMFVELEQARSMVLVGLQALRASDARERARLAAATKARVAQAGLFIGAHAIQLHGGIGITEEYTVGHYFKRLIAFNLRRGSADAQVERFARLIERMDGQV